MLKSISAMFENYDTQMIDYMADIDMQMQAFASDPWLQHDETKMEEDTPGTRPENFEQLKTDDRDRGELTIEIDMEEHPSAEYDMVDDEHVSTADLLDVEVYDASLAHSPAMAALNSAPPAEPTFSTFVSVRAKHQDPVLPSVSETGFSTGLLSSPVSQDALSSLQGDTLATPTIQDIHEDVRHADDFTVAGSDFDPPTSQDQVLQLSENALQDSESTQKLEVQHFHISEEINSETVHEIIEEERKDPIDETRAAGEVANLEQAAEVRVNIESTSSGDPHEISEGVYIDPPPPVLLSVAFEELEFDHCFFNQPAEWLTPQIDQEQEAHRIILHHLPTLYYESLVTLFEALRQDEFIQANFQLHDEELVLQAVDLALTITEDNIYAREVSLHDLNMLHDASGIPGPLRTRVCTSSPRFIARYQQLQDHVSRIQLEQPPREISTGIQTEVNSNGQSSSPVHEESHPNLDPPEDDEVGVNSTHESSQSAGAEAHPLPQNSSDDKNNSNNVAEAAQLPNKEESGLIAGSEGDGFLAQDPASNSEDHVSEPDPHPGGDEFASNGEHPTRHDDTQGGDSAIGEGEAAVISHDVLGAKISEQGRSQEDDVASDHVADLQQDDGQGHADNTQDSKANVRDTQQVEAAEPGADEGEDDVYEPDEHAHEYGDVEGDQGHLQQPGDEGNDMEEAVKEVDNVSQPSYEVDGEDYTQEAMPDLPTDPISFDDEHWELGFEDGGNVDGGNVDGSWHDGDDNDHSVSNNSSVTLSSRASKRTFEEYESDIEGCEDDTGRQWTLSGSPGLKRSRIE